MISSIRSPKCQTHITQKPFWYLIQATWISSELYRLEFIEGFLLQYTLRIQPQFHQSKTAWCSATMVTGVTLAPELDYDYAHQSVLKMIDLLFKIQDDSLGLFHVVTNTSDLDHCIENYIMAAVLHLEGAEPIQTDPR